MSDNKLVIIIYIYTIKNFECVLKNLCACVYVALYS